jgi:hypothetical protein
MANGFFALQILLFREENSRQSRSLHSHSSFCEEVFSICVVAGIIDPSRRDHRSRLQPNEVDRTNILAPGFILLPAFTPESFRGLALGKSYPVTAAQLLPIHTGFLAPIH